MKDTSQGFDPNISLIVPFKRKRGRPHKYLISKTLNSDQGVNLGWNKDRYVVYGGTSNENFIGQIVYGSVELTFEAGYLLNVKIGNSDTTLRGAVFKPGRFVPVSADNDVAPEVPMCERNEIPVPFEHFGRNFQVSDKKKAYGMKGNVKTPRCKPDIPIEIYKSNGISSASNTHFEIASGSFNQKSGSPSFECLLAEVMRRVEVPMPSMETISNSPVRNHVDEEDDDSSESDEALSVEPLQELKPGVSRQPEPVGSDKMSELFKVIAGQHL